MKWTPKQLKFSVISRHVLNIPRIPRIAFTFLSAFFLAFVSLSASAGEYSSDLNSIYLRLQEIRDDVDDMRADYAQDYPELSLYIESIASQADAILRSIDAAKDSTTGGFNVVLAASQLSSLTSSISALDTRMQSLGVGTVTNFLGQVDFDEFRKLLANQFTQTFGENLFGLLNRWATEGAWFSYTGAGTTYINVGTLPFAQDGMPVFETDLPQTLGAVWLYDVKPDVERLFASVGASSIQSNIMSAVQHQYNLSSNFYYGFVQNVTFGSGTNRYIRVAFDDSNSVVSNLSQISSFYSGEDRIALDTNSVTVLAPTSGTNLVDNSKEEKALEEKSDELIEDFENDVEDKQEDAQDAVDELVSTVDESFDEIKDKLDAGQHEERLLEGLAPSTEGGSSKLLIWNAWEHAGITVPKLEIDFGDKRLENFRKRANLILRSCYWLAFCLTAINLLRSLAVYLFSLGHVNEVAANALDAVGASGWQYQDASAETAKYVEWMASGGKKG